MQNKERYRNISGLGCGWITKCRHCGKEFKTFSHKQVYCSVECSFLDRAIEQLNGCVEWQGNITNDGYGVLRGKDKKMISAHRYAWERVNGKIPEGMCICHKCDNRKCVNINHMFLGTRYDNNHDRSLKGRSGKRTFTDEERKKYSLMFRGDNSHYHKLTEKQVAEILKIGRSISSRKLAKIYNVTKSTILRILNRKGWTHVFVE